VRGNRRWAIGKRVKSEKLGVKCWKGEMSEKGRKGKKENKN